jgi:hypothetical protein
MRKIVIIKALRPLASIAYQRRYIVGGTKDEYVLPDELLESAYSSIQPILTRPEVSSTFSEAELSCILKMLRCLDREGDKLPSDGSISNEDLVENNAAWAAIRSTAQQCLNVLGVNLSEWEEKMETED